MKEIRRVNVNKTTGGKYVVIPKNSLISAGDIVVVYPLPKMDLNVEV